MARGDGGSDSASPTVCPPSRCGLRHLPCSLWRIFGPPPFLPASPLLPSSWGGGVQPAETGPRLRSPSTWGCLSIVPRGKADELRLHQPCVDLLPLRCTQSSCWFSAVAGGSQLLSAQGL